MLSPGKISQWPSGCLRMYQVSESVILVAPVLSCGYSHFSLGRCHRSMSFAEYLHEP